MSEKHIIKGHLSEGENLRSLLKLGIGDIQEMVSSNWTDFNTSDPGVTVLEQLCYALSELGYCINFSIEDILTQPNGKINYADQFYTPEKYLTTGPVTIDDFKKVIISTNDEIINACIFPRSRDTFQPYFFAGFYQTNQYISQPSGNSTSQDNNHKDYEESRKETIKRLKQAVNKQLDKNRNLNEIFIPPEPLKQKPYNLSGKLDLYSKTDVVQTILTIQQSINDFILPKVNEVGYKSSILESSSIDEFFNGPLLNNGMIQFNGSENKKDTAEVYQIAQRINGVDNVIKVSDLKFLKPNFNLPPNQNTEYAGAAELTSGTTEGDPETIRRSLSIEVDFKNKISAAQDEVLNINVIHSFLHGHLKLECLGEKINPEDYSSVDFYKINSAYQEIHSIEAKLNIEVEKPKGKYRDINSYYSVQNTFPSIFNVGENELSKTSTKLQIAQSKQLRGYITMFDQILANYFSQLANVDQQFSFVNGTRGYSPNDPWRLRKVTSRKSSLNKIAYSVFAPTYFYQSLYDVPQMSTLAKGMLTPLNYKLVSSNTDYSKNWSEYKDDPYNPYILGLKYLVCNDTQDQERRNKALDHLLAVNGESPYVVNEIIDDRAYFGTIKTNQLILKSLLLQNLELLSYNRQKAYNYQGASILQLPSKLLPYQNASEIKDEIERKKIEKINDESIAAVNKTFLESDFIDFVFQTKRVNDREKIYNTDFQNFSALELKLCLIFGLRSIYKQHFNYALRTSSLECADNTTTNTHYKNENEIIPCVKQWYWLIHERRGFIFFENRLFLLNAKFKLFIRVKVTFIVMVEDTPEVSTLEVCYQVSYIKPRVMNYKNYSIATNIIENISKTELDTALESESKTIDNLLKLEEATPDSIVSFECLSNSASIGALAEWNKTDEPKSTFPFDARSEKFEEVTLFFPYEIEFFQSPSFKNRLDIFLDDSLPVRVRPDVRFEKHEVLEKEVIPGFVAYHNDLRDKTDYKIKKTDRPLMELERDLESVVLAAEEDKDTAIQRDLNSFYESYIKFMKITLAKKDPKKSDDSGQST